MAMSLGRSLVIRPARNSESADPGRMEASTFLRRGRQAPDFSGMWTSGPDRLWWEDTVGEVVRARSIKLADCGCRRRPSETRLAVCRAQPTLARRVHRQWARCSLDLLSTVQVE